MSQNEAVPASKLRGGVLPWVVGAVGGMLVGLLVGALVFAGPDCTSVRDRNEELLVAEGPAPVLDEDLGQELVQLKDEAPGCFSSSEQGFIDTIAE